MTYNLSELRSYPAKYRYRKYIQEPQEKINKLKEESQVDRVTGLPNEKPFFEMLEGLQNVWIRSSEKIPITGSFIVADLTGLHETNDDFGRNLGGDDYLKAVGEALTGISRPGDRAFRLGTSADEFVLHLHDVKNRDDLVGVLDRIDTRLDQLEREKQKEYKGIRFGLSYSISTYGGRCPPQKAYEDAVNRLGEAKTSTKKGVRVGDVGRIFVYENND